MLKEILTGTAIGLIISAPLLLGGCDGFTRHQRALPMACRIRRIRLVSRLASRLASRLTKRSRKSRKQSQSSELRKACQLELSTSASYWPKRDFPAVEGVGAADGDPPVALFPAPLAAAAAAARAAAPDF